MSRRQKRHLFLGVLATIAVCAVVIPRALTQGDAAKSDEAEVTQFKSEVRSLAYDDRFDFAVDSLFTANESDVVSNCLKIILDTSKQLSRNDEAIAVLEEYLTQVPEGSEDYQDAFYACARVLHRMGEKEEAVALFKEGIARGWKARGRPDAFEAYKESLFRNDPPMYMVEQFNYSTEDITGEVYSRYRDYLSMFSINNLWSMNKRGEFSSPGRPFSAQEEILQRLQKSRRHPHHFEIAEALCLIIDQEYDAAVDRLSQIDNSLSFPPRELDPKNTQEFYLYNEKLNLPLYVATARLFQGGESIPEARRAMTEFYKRNRFRPDHVVHKLMRLTYALETRPIDERKRVHEVTGFLLEEVFADEPIAKGVSKGLRLHAIDVHMGEYFRQGNVREAKRFAEQVVAEYEPSDLACNNSLFCLGCLCRHEGDLARAEEIFTKLMEVADERWQRVSACQLAELRMDMGRDAREIQPLLNRVAREAPPKEAEFYRYHETLKRFEELRVIQE